MLLNEHIKKLSSLNHTKLSQSIDYLNSVNCFVLLYRFFFFASFSSSIHAYFLTLYSFKIEHFRFWLLNLKIKRNF